MDGNLLKDGKQLEPLFKVLAKKDEPILFSCGSGITACILALGAEISGYKNISVMMVLGLSGGVWLQSKNITLKIYSLTLVLVSNKILVCHTTCNGFWQYSHTPNCVKMEE